MNPDVQVPLQATAAPSEDPVVATEHGWRGERAAFVGLAALVAAVVLASGYFIWHTSHSVQTANSLQVINVRLNNGSLTPNIINASYGQRVSIVFTAAHQSIPQETTLPQYGAQTTVAQGSTTNFEFMASTKGEFPIYRVDNSGRHEIGKVMVR